MYFHQISQTSMKSRAQRWRVRRGQISLSGGQGLSARGDGGLAHAVQ
jgi:hypothetical protein